MEMYKKKPLKFTKIAKINELKVNRKDQRHNRFSVQRPLLNEEPAEDEISRSQPKKPENANQSRFEMLRKWRLEKELKKQQESRLKKPGFKVGAAPVTRSTPSHGASFLAGKVPYSAQESRLFGSKPVQSKLPNKQTPQESRHNSSKPVQSKLPNKQTSQISRPSSIARNLPGPSVAKPKLELPKPASQIKKNVPQIQNIKPKVQSNAGVSKSKFNNNTITRPSNQVSKIGSLSKPVSTQFQNKNTSQPSNGVLKPTAPKVPNKASFQAPKGNSAISKIQTKNTSQDKATKKPATSQPLQSNVTCRRKVDAKEELPSHQPVTPKEEEKSADCNTKDITFHSEISVIEPSEKSFAPVNFTFNPALDLSSSFYLKDGPSAIFQRIKGEIQRTSTPLQSPPEYSEGASGSKKYSLCSPGKNPCRMSLKFDQPESNILHPSDELSSPQNMPRICETFVFSSPSIPLGLHPTKCIDVKEEEKLAGENVSGVDRFIQDVGLASPETQSPSEDKENEPVGSQDPKKDKDADGESPCKESSFKQEGEIEKKPQEAGLSSVSAKFPELVKTEACKPPQKLLPGVAHKTRGCRQSARPLLESINESLEFLETTKSPKKCSRAANAEGFTPRRSVRLARLSTLDSPDNLFSVRRPSLLDSPGINFSDSDSPSELPDLGLAYDFDNLNLEKNKTPPVQPVPPCKYNTRKVSLLYTPPPKQRERSLRKSALDNLMSFSPGK